MSQLIQKSLASKRAVLFISSINWCRCTWIWVKQNIYRSFKRQWTTFALVIAVIVVVVVFEFITDQKWDTHWNELIILSYGFFFYYIATYHKQLQPIMWWVLKSCVYVVFTETGLKCDTTKKKCVTQISSLQSKNIQNSRYSCCSVDKSDTPISHNNDISHVMDRYLTLYCH